MPAAARTSDCEPPRKSTDAMTDGPGHATPGFAAPIRARGGGIARSGTRVRRNRRSVVDPMSSLLAPLRPCVPTTMRSHRSRRATAAIVASGAPVSTRYLIASDLRVPLGRDFATNGGSSLSAAWGRVRSPKAVAAAATRSGSLTCRTCSRPADRCASTAAYRSANAEGSEKSVAQRMARNSGERFASRVFGMAVTVATNMPPWPLPRHPRSCENAAVSSLASGVRSGHSADGCRKIVTTENQQADISSIGLT